ncbi:permease-like cell division protein FtsX [Patescibacteria group bacterium]|nr:permease-like cell division protein FtsX [Patescibacteria group bacterium]
MFSVEFIRVLKFALQSIFRNFRLSVVTVVIIILALFSISFLSVFNLLAQHVMDMVENKTNVYIDLTANATNEQAAILIEELKKLSAIQEAVFITPAETLEQFKERHQNDALMLESLEALEGNPFTGSILLSVYNIDDFPVILNELSKKDYAQYLEIEDREFTDSKLLIEKISEYSKKIQRFGLAISLLFLLISAMVVFNTIQVKILTHREEIGIMRLVGASNSFIRFPFLIEVLIYSFVAVIILMILVYPLLALSQPYIDNFLKEYSVSLVSLVNHNFFLLFGIQFLAAMVITIVSSLVAVRRYIKV